MYNSPGSKMMKLSKQRSREPIELQTELEINSKFAAESNSPKQQKHMSNDQKGRSRQETNQILEGLNTISGKVSDNRKTNQELISGETLLHLMSQIDGSNSLDLERRNQKRSDLIVDRNETVTTPISDTDSEESEIESSEEMESRHDRRQSRPSKKRKRKNRSRSRSGKKKKKSNKRLSDSEIENNPKVKFLMQQVAEMAEQLKKVQGRNDIGIKNFDNKCQKQTNEDVGQQNKVVKSPSDTTLYMPAIRRLDKEFSPQQVVEKVLRDNSDKHDEPQVEAINKFLQNIRIGQTGSRSSGQIEDEPQPSTSSGRRHGESTVRRDTTDGALLEAERYKATIQAPPQGMDERNYLRYLRMNDDDDDFFHIICHIDGSLKAKIRKGGYIDLEKLLQRPDVLNFKNEGKLELVHRNGESYFVPSVDKSLKIDNIRKWEQAFRIYASVYCEANPTRSVEILQYIDVINNAAKVFTWENVARYDYIFRHLQESKPHRSWAKTYTQMWNVTLNEPKRSVYETHNREHSSRKQDGQQICWKFNKNACNYGKKCRFEHKCSYCGSYNHGYWNCSRKTGGNNYSKNRNRRSSSSSRASSSSRSNRKSSSGNSGDNDEKQ